MSIQYVKDIKHQVNFSPLKNKYERYEFIGPMAVKHTFLIAKEQRWLHCGKPRAQAGSGE
jgi:hypothetical protein